MSDESSNIARISFEEIQEFEHLNLFEIPPAVGNKSTLLLYDTVTKTFSVGELDIDANVISIIQQSSLVTNVTIKTDDLPTERGYVFYKGQSLTDIMQILAKPTFDGKVTVKGINKTFDATETDWSYEQVIVEIAAQTDIEISNDYEQNQAGSISGAQYYIDTSTPITPAPNITVTLSTEDTRTVLLEAITADSTTYTGKAIYGSLVIKPVYPSFYGVSDTGNKPGSFTTANSTMMLVDTIAEEPLNIPIKNNVNQYYWFAVSTKVNPFNWIGVYDNGHLAYSKEGLVETTFENLGNTVHRGNTYNVFMTPDKTIFDTNIKINFFNNG